jgi:hypothetical protein
MVAGAGPDRRVVTFSQFSGDIPLIPIGDAPRGRFGRQ